MITIGVRVFLVGAAVAGCRQTPASLPPSTDWQAAPAGTWGEGAVSVGAPLGEPAQALPPGHPPVAPERAPHGTIGTDVSKLGLPAPDPDRALDPTHRVRGVIAIAGGLAGRVHDGGAVFVVAKRDDDGKPSGPPLAVQKLTWKAGLPFELTEQQAMIAGTQLTGDVIVTARFDQDGDALTRQPGDVTGQVRVKVPADAVALALDTVLP